MTRRNRNDYRRQMAERAATAPIPARQTATSAVNPAHLQRTTPNASTLTARERKLRRNAARLPGPWNDPLRELAYETILAMPIYSTNSDQNAIRNLHRYATWVHRLEGCFDITTQMDDTRIAAWVDAELGNLKEPSRTAAWFILRRIRDGNERPTKRMSTRTEAAAPYTATEWLRLEFAIAALQDKPTTESGRMLLDLTGGCGLRGGEVFRIQGTHIINRGGITYVQATNANGAVRDVPVIGPAATRIAAHAGDPRYLVSPGRIQDRDNTIANLNTRINKKTPYGFAFRATRARNTWLVALAALPIPFPLIARIADLQPGSHSLNDLLLHLPPMSDDDASRAAAAHLTMAGAR